MRPSLSAGRKLTQEEREMVTNILRDPCADPACNCGCHAIAELAAMVGACDECGEVFCEHLGIQVRG
jgi:hypothetical protein